MERLKESAIAELQARRAAIQQELSTIERDLDKLAGVSRSGRGNFSPKRLVTLADLKDLLAAAPERTLNIRKENLDFLNVKTLVHANPSLLRLGGKAPWPTVTLLK